MAKLCTDCRYCAIPHISVPMCEHEYNLSLVDGLLNKVTCQDMRATTGACGPEGQLFVGKAQNIPEWTSA